MVCVILPAYEVDRIDTGVFYCLSPYLLEVESPTEPEDQYLNQPG